MPGLKPERGRAFPAARRRIFFFDGGSNALRGAGIGGVMSARVRRSARVLRSCGDLRDCVTAAPGERQAMRTRGASGVFSAGKPKRTPLRVFPVPAEADAFSFARSDRGAFQSVAECFCVLLLS